MYTEQSGIRPHQEQEYNTHFSTVPFKKGNNLTKRKHLSKRLFTLLLVLGLTLPIVGRPTMVGAQGSCLDSGGTVCTTTTDPKIILTDTDASTGAQVGAWLETHKSNGSLNTRIGQNGLDLIVDNRLNDGNIRLLLDEDTPGNVLVERGGLHVTSGDFKVLGIGADGTTASIGLGYRNNTARIRIGGSGPAASNGLSIEGVSNRQLLRIFGNGRVAIGTDVEPPRGIKLQVSSGGIQTEGVLYAAGLVQTNDSFKVDRNGASVGLGFTNNVARVRVGGSGDAANNGFAVLGVSDKQLLHVDRNGHLTIRSLEITGGADLAEPFPVTDAASVEPGTLVALDPENPGQLRVATDAYDTMVAGVISGAGGVNPGLIMSQDELIDGETHPVALTGRVYVKAVGPVKVGNLLTTSDVAGHAMAATDRDQAFGATLGKAMGTLDEGETGLVLVLVALQ